MKQSTTPPPYTNRWGTMPGPDFRRCQGKTKTGSQCRRGARKCEQFCDAHLIKPDSEAKILTTGQ